MGWFWGVWGGCGVKGMGLGCRGRRGARGSARRRATGTASPPGDAAPGRGWGGGLGFPPAAAKPSPGNSSGQPLKPLFVSLGFLKCLPRRLRTRCPAPGAASGRRDGDGAAPRGRERGCQTQPLGQGLPLPADTTKTEGCHAPYTPRGPHATRGGHPQHPPAPVGLQGGGLGTGPPGARARASFPSWPQPPLQTLLAWPCRAVPPAGLAAKAPISCLARGPGATFIGDCSDRTRGKGFEPREGRLGLEVGNGSLPTQTHPVVLWCHDSLIPRFPD